jgi:hypothetical protein
MYLENQSVSYVDLPEFHVHRLLTNWHGWYPGNILLYKVAVKATSHTLHYLPVTS